MEEEKENASASPGIMVTNSPANLGQPTQATQQETQPEQLSPRLDKEGGMSIDQISQKDSPSKRTINTNANNQTERLGTKRSF